MRHKGSLGVLASLVLVLAAPALGTDWPQLQGDAARTGRTPDTLEPPYRVRWMWFGPQGTLRNQNSEPGQPGWDDDLTTRDNYDFPTPDPVTYTLAIQAQPVIANGRVFIGDMQGSVYGIDEFDGSTLWTASNPGGTVDAAAVAAGVVVFHSLSGYVRGYDVTDGTLAWEFDTGKPITGAPCVVGSTVFSPSHNGRVYAIDTTDGTLLWESQYLGAPVSGGLCSDGSSVYVGCENMEFYQLSAADGSVQNQRTVVGQSFRMLWPVVYDSRVWITTQPVPAIGSEYLMEELMADSTSIDNEQDNILRWLQGDTNGGAWPDASTDWKHFWVFNTSDFTEPFVVPVGYTDGVGRGTSPPVVDNQGRMLKWFKTRYPTLTTVGSFGTDYSTDVSAIDMTTGRRVPIDNGKLSGQGGDTDNLYWMMTAGDRLFMSNDFRGMQMIDLTTSDGRLVLVKEHEKDDATWDADIWYWQGEQFVDDPYPPVTDYPDAEFKGRMAPSVAGSQLYLTEPFGVTCVEHLPQ